MWQVDNLTPFAADRCWVRDRDGTETWLVAVKCTFDVLPDGSTRISQEQPPVLHLPEFHGEPGGSSIKYEADLVLTKTTTDVIVVGHAHAPDARAVTELDAGFRVGALQKVVRVVGDREWGAFGPTPAQPFVSMPLVYERALGGVDRLSSRPEVDWDWRNPVGCGFAVDKAHLAGVAVPNIESREAPMGAWDARPAPAGLGAIASHWQPRAGFGGTYDERWKATRQPLLAEDLDDRFFQCAPADQQAAQFLVGGEEVMLLNLSPLGNLRFRLPRLHLGFETFFYDGGQEIHRQRRLHTVILEPDFPRVSLVWHSALACHTRVTKLERTEVTLKRSVDRREGTDAGADLAGAVA